MRVLVTGGAGFIGSSTCLGLRLRHPEWEVVALDNLYRRGSELNLPRLKASGVRFVHGDVRHLDDVLAAGPFDAMVECSAEPSVMAGAGSGAGLLIDTNLRGAVHCFEAAARFGAQVVFLSTSRVYPVRGLEELVLVERPTRFELAAEQPLPGASEEGVSESFPLEGARTLYGTTKLAGELLLAEYAETHGVATVIDRCGVVAGPWQMGKVDQGVFTHWALSFMLGRPLSYIGFGGTGKQVRDVLHVEDLVDLIDDQLLRPGHWDGRTFNVGGGRAGSLSLLEATEICRELTGVAVDVGSVPGTRAGDVPSYLSDCRGLFEHTAWRPARPPEAVLEDIVSWIAANEELVRGALG